MDIDASPPPPPPAPAPADADAAPGGAAAKDGGDKAKEAAGKDKPKDKDGKDGKAGGSGKDKDKDKEREKDGRAARSSARSASRDPKDPKEGKDAKEPRGGSGNGGSGGGSSSRRKKYVTDNALLAAFRCARVGPLLAEAFCVCRWHGRVSLISIVPLLTLLCRPDRFFDRTGCGYFRTDDLRRLLHALGLGLPHRVVRELARGKDDALGPNVRFKSEWAMGKCRRAGGRVPVRCRSDAVGAWGHAAGGVVGPSLASHDK